MAKADSTYKSRQVENDRMTGYGIIQPGAGANRPLAGSPYPMKNPLPAIGAAIKKALYPEVRPATPAEDQSAKLRGQRAYYEGKIQRNKQK